MKQFRRVIFTLAMVGLIVPIASLSSQESTLATRLRSLQSKATASLKNAASLLKQKAHCLINYDACSKRDKLAISNAFGFTMGYGIHYTALIDRALQYYGVNPRISLQSTFRDALIVSVAYTLAQETGLTGPLMMSQGTGYFGNFIHQLSIAPNKTAFLATQRGLFQAHPAFDKILFLLIIAIEAVSIMQEIAYAVKYENQSYLTSIARYLKMNIKCIWDEKYCMPQDNAEQRRIGLYFWLGYIQGRVARELRTRFLPVGPIATGAPGPGPAPTPTPAAAPASRGHRLGTS